MVINPIDGITDNTRIAIAFGIIFLDNEFFVFFIGFFHVFGSLENTRTVVVIEIFLNAIDGSQGMKGEHISKGVNNQRAKRIQGVEMATFFGLFHGGQNLTFGKVLVTNNIDFPDFHLWTLIDVDEHVDIVFTSCIGFLLDINFYIVIPLVKIKILNDACGLGQQMLSSNIATREIDLIADIVGLALLDTLKRKLRHTRLFLDDNLQKHLITHKLSRVDSHILKQPLFPYLANAQRNVIPWNSNLIAHS